MTHEGKQYLKRTSNRTAKDNFEAAARLIQTARTRGVHIESEPEDNKTETRALAAALLDEDGKLPGPGEVEDNLAKNSHTRDSFVEKLVELGGIDLFSQ